MRLVAVKHLVGGETIGKDIESPVGGILLKASTIFRLSFVDRLLERGITEIFIDDEISSGIEPPEILSSHVKQRIADNLKNQFNTIQDVMAVDLQEIQQLTTTILENINQSELIFDIMDLKRNDSYTYSHCLNVAILSCAIGRKLGANFEMLEKIVTGALLHDIGKMILPKDILNKPGKLTLEEREILQSHSKVGYDLIKNESSLTPISKAIILCHHEREDGTGYPLGKGEDLHMAAKIVAVADVFDALISNRPYRDGFPLNVALSILKQEALNEEVIATLENMVAFYPVGCSVLLSNQSIGLVEQNFADDLNRPLIRIIIDGKTRKREDLRLDLRKFDGIHIVQKIGHVPSKLL